MQIRKKLVSALIASSFLAAVPAAFAAEAVPAAAAPAVAPAAEAKPSEYVKPNMKHESYGTLNIVVPITSDDKGIQGMKLRNIGNALKAAEAWKGKINVAIVLYAKGLTLIKNPDDKTQKQLDELAKNGVRVKVCNNSMLEQGIDFHKLYHVTDADIVPSGFAEVAYLQAKKHFVVDPSY